MEKVRLIKKPAGQISGQFSRFKSKQKLLHEGLCSMSNIIMCPEYSQAIGRVLKMTYLGGWDVNSVMYFEKSVYIYLRRGSDRVHIRVSDHRSKHFKSTRRQLNIYLKEMSYQLYDTAIKRLTDDRYRIVPMGRRELLIRQYGDRRLEKF